MSFAIRIADGATQTLDALAQGIDGIEPVAGESAKLVLMEHLTEKDAASSSHKTAGRLGASPSGLYAEFAKAISHSTSPGKATLSINHAAAHMRYAGGDIRPVNAANLTIPIDAKSYGKSVDDFAHTDTLKWFFGRSEKPYAVGVASDPSRKLFILTKHVHQTGDKTVLPPDDIWTRKILATIADALDLES